MIGEETSPGRVERLIRAIPEGAVLRGVFVALLVVAASIAFLDYRQLAEANADRDRISRTEPMPLARPEPGDQVRPYLPRTIPVAPDRGVPQLPGWDGPVDGEAMAERMRFVAGTDGAITAIGRIEIGTANDFRDFLETPEAAGARTLVLHSPGGAVDDAIVMARTIRDKRLSTMVPADGYCASACPLVMAGGLTRKAGPDAWVGVHQVYALPLGNLARDVDRSIAGVQETIARCQQLLVAMGVDPAVWIKAMQTPADSLYVLTRDEMVAFRMIRPFPDDASFIGPPAPAAPKVMSVAEEAADPAAAGPDAI
ncbi:hypothetical protein VQ042_06680 [Aurantimonas sp. A2-1-M11]|uniref:COG3904 family protein n=1 Tax=Aurantimonas sp. A2-1-M11 TaxID=3113712 RepID=UPI002F92BE0E